MPLLGCREAQEVVQWPGRQQTLSPPFCLAPVANGPLKRRWCYERAAAINAIQRKGCLETFQVEELRRGHSSGGLLLLDPGYLKLGSALHIWPASYSETSRRQAPSPLSYCPYMPLSLTDADQSISRRDYKVAVCPCAGCWVPELENLDSDEDPDFHHSMRIATRGT